MPYWSLILLVLLATQPALTAAEDAEGDDSNGGTEEPVIPEDPDC
ncbi:hypothetical protein [Thiohalobacter thiocyanaticus]|nr:hypothetical protein [Thiohalobacter thiocyanaticus]